MKRISVIVLVCALLLSMLPGGHFASAAARSGAGMKAGDRFTLGEYPQTRVTDSTLLNSLKSAYKSWNNYPYYSKNTGSNASSFPTKKNTTMMQYADFTHNGVKYRAVKILSYRPIDVTKPPESEDKQSSNGYVKNTEYYFKYEPIRWVLLDPATGLAVSEKVLDSQPFNAYYEKVGSKLMNAFDSARTASYYGQSTLVNWLNAQGSFDSAYSSFNFLYTAFTSSERSSALQISDQTYLDNGMIYYDTNLVFLLSKDQATSNYSKFGDALNSDYAEAQGMSKKGSSGGTPWYTRTAASDSSVYYCLGSSCTTSNTALSAITSTATGIRPAIKVNLNSSYIVGPFKISGESTTTSIYPKLTWEANSDASCYEVFRCTSSPDAEAGWGAPIASMGGSGVRYEDTSATPGKSYYYRVRRTTSAGQEMSAYISVTCRIARPAISSTTRDANTGKPSLTWKNSDGATKYSVMRKPSSSGSWTTVATVQPGTGTTTTYLDTTATAGVTYNYKIYAHGSSTSFDSESASTTLSCGLAKPTGVTVTDTSDGLPLLSWNAVKGAGGYRIEFKKTSETEWHVQRTLATSYVCDESEYGASYQYRLIAVISTSDTATTYDSKPVTGTYSCAPLPAFTKQPADYLVFYNKTQLWPTVSAVGKNLTYRWYVYRPKSDNGDYELAYTGDNTWSIIPDMLDDGMLYYVVATDKFGRSVKSQTAWIAALTHPKPVTVNVGQTATFSVSTMLDEHVSSYQWQVLAPGSTEWKDAQAASAKTATYSFKTVAAHNGYKVRCVATFYNGSTDTSWSADLTVKTAKPSITTQPKDASVGVGYDAKFTVVAKGTGTLSYQWQAYNPNTGKWTNSSAPTAKKATLVITAQTGHHNFKFRCIVTDSNGSTTSQPALLTVRPGITTQPSDTTAAVGATAKFTVAAKGIGTLSYQWQSQAPGSTGWKDSSAPSAKTATLSFTAQAAHNGYKFRCVITDANGNSSVTRGALLNVKPGFTTQPKATTAAVGSTAKFTVAAKGVGTLSYQWQAYNPNTGKWTDSSAASAKTATLSITVQAAHNNFKFRCVVTDGNGRTNTSSAALLTVKVGITTQPKNVTVTAGTTAKFTIVAKGVGTISYQWQRWDKTKETWVDSTASGAKTATLSVPGQKTYSGNEYRCVVMDENGKATSNTVTLTVK